MQTSSEVAPEALKPPAAATAAEARVPAIMQDSVGSESLEGATPRDEKECELSAAADGMTAKGDSIAGLKNFSGTWHKVSYRDCICQMTELGCVHLE